MTDAKLPTGTRQTFILDTFLAMTMAVKSVEPSTIDIYRSMAISVDDDVHRVVTNPKHLQAIYNSMVDIRVKTLLRPIFEIRNKSDKLSTLASLVIKKRIVFDYVMARTSENPKLRYLMDMSDEDYDKWYMTNDMDSVMALELDDESKAQPAGTADHPWTHAFDHLRTAGRDDAQRVKLIADITAGDDKTNASAEFPFGKPASTGTPAPSGAGDLKSEVKRATVSWQDTVAVVPGFGDMSQTAAGRATDVMYDDQGNTYVEVVVESLPYRIPVVLGKDGATAFKIADSKIREALTMKGVLIGA